MRKWLSYILSGKNISKPARTIVRLSLILSCLLLTASLLLAVYAGPLTGPGSRQRRAALIRKLGLPERISANALLDVANILMDKTELISLLSSLNPQ